MIVRDLAGRLGLQIDNSSFAAADRLFDAVKMGLFAIAGATAAAGIGLAAMLRATAENAFQTERSAEQIGLTTQRLQEYQFSAERAGVSSSDLDLALRRMAHSAYEAATYGGQVAGAYYKLGVVVRDANTGKIRPTEDILRDLIDAFARLPAGIEKSALAQQIFSRNGQRLIPWLNLGSRGIDDLTEKAGKYGTVLSTEAIARGIQFRQSLFDLNSALVGVRNEISDRLFPVVSGIVDSMAEWLRIHRHLIAAGVEKFFNKVAEILQRVWRIGEKAVEVWDKLGGVAKGSIAGIFLLGTAMVAPWLTLLAVLGLIADDIITYFTGGRSLLGIILYKFEEIGGWAGIFRKIWREILDTLAEGVKTIFDPIIAGFDRVIGGIKDGLAALNPLSWFAKKGAISSIPGIEYGVSDIVAANVGSFTSRIGGLSSTFVFNVSQLPGEGGEEFANRVAGIVREERDKDLRRLDAGMNQ